VQNRNYGLDIFRIMCCLGVLDYHIVGAYLNGTNVCSGEGQELYFLAAFCVPGFFSYRVICLVKKANWILDIMRER